MIDINDRIGDATEGLVLIGDSRFGTHDIRLSSALCCLGFSLRTDTQPIAVTLDLDLARRLITFFHADGSEHPKMGRTTARDIDLWWNSPIGKYTIEGWDDALNAIRRVHVEREDNIHLAKHPVSPAWHFRNGQFATHSLHWASILRACDIPRLGYEVKSKQWIFGKGAEVIAELIKDGGKPKERPLSNDLCIDWMLEALRYHDWLKQLIKDPDNIPVIELRDGGKILQISSAMPDEEKRKWIVRL